VILGALGFAIILAGIRLVLGPTIPDRVMAFDLIVVIVMAKITTIAIMTDQWVFLDAVIILALLAFLATVAFARYLNKTSKTHRRWPR
jgi:multicomponent Na+:H+ antiporter subunit F